MAYTLDTTLGKLLEHPQAKTIIDKYLPGASTNPMIEMIKPMTLNSIIAQPMAAQMGFTKDKAELILAEINKYVK